eukprot:gene21963-biopygen2694
MGPQPHTYRGG